jgi:hypothetical protein
MYQRGTKAPLSTYSSWLLAQSVVVSSLRGGRTNGGTGSVAIRFFISLGLLIVLALVIVSFVVSQPSRNFHGLTQRSVAYVVFVDLSVLANLIAAVRTVVNVVSMRQDSMVAKLLPIHRGRFNLAYLLGATLNPVLVSFTISVAIGVYLLYEIGDPLYGYVLVLSETLSLVASCLAVVILLSVAVIRHTKGGIQSLLITLLTLPLLGIYGATIGSLGGGVALTRLGAYLHPYDTWLCLFPQGSLISIAMGRPIWLTFLYALLHLSVAVVLLQVAMSKLGRATLKPTEQRTTRRRNSASSYVTTAVNPGSLILEVMSRREGFAAQLSAFLRSIVRDPVGMSMAFSYLSPLALMLIIGLSRPLDAPELFLALFSSISLLRSVSLWSFRLTPTLILTPIGTGAIAYFFVFWLAVTSLFGSVISLVVFVNVGALSDLIRSASVALACYVVGTVAIAGVLYFPRDNPISWSSRVTIWGTLLPFFAVSVVGSVLGVAAVFGVNAEAVALIGFLGVAIYVTIWLFRRGSSMYIELSRKIISQG